MSVSSILSMVLFRYTAFLLFFCLEDLSIVESRLLNLQLLLDCYLSLLLVILVFALYIYKYFYVRLHKYLQLLYLLDELAPLSLFNA